MSKGQIKRLLWVEDLSKALQCLEDIRENFYMLMYSERSPMFRRPLKFISYTNSVWMVFYVYKPSKSSSKCRRPIWALLCAEGLFKLDYALKGFWKIFNLTSPLKALIYIEVFWMTSMKSVKTSDRLSMCKRPVKSLLWSEDLCKVFHI